MKHEKTNPIDEYFKQHKVLQDHFKIKCLEGCEIEDCRRFFWCRIDENMELMFADDKDDFETGNEYATSYAYQHLNVDASVFETDKNTAIMTVNDTTCSLILMILDNSKQVQFDQIDW